MYGFSVLFRIVGAFFLCRERKELYLRCVSNGVWQWNYMFIVFDRMLVSRFWARLRSVSTVTSPSWTARKSLHWKPSLRETGTFPWVLTRHLGSVCVIMTRQFITHLCLKTHAHTHWNSTVQPYFYKCTHT